MTANSPADNSATKTDVLLIGGGIMSATLGAFLKQLQPDWDISLYERLDRAGLESSDPWNNAGTGHAALCELNYSPAAADGSVDPAKAVGINEQFQVSRQFWSHLVSAGHISNNFINPLPHMSFVWGDAHSEYLRRRYESLSAQPLFKTMEFSEDPAKLAEWAPLIMEGRDPSQRVAASRVAGGTDVDFGALTRELTNYLGANGVNLHFGHEVGNVSRSSTGGWDVKVKDRASGTTRTVSARFVFIGGGGGALHLLQASGIPEGKGFGGFPVSGQFLRSTDDSIISRHNAKVYGQASVGAPPMSVPHLDTRFVNGKRSLLFGPYGGFSPKFLKTGSYLDLPLSVRPSNLVPMLGVAKDNMSLVKYLVTEVMKTREGKTQALQEFMPSAKTEGWDLITAGQRVQVIKKDPKKGGVLQFGTELITAADGSIGALLGASPGASTAPPIMINLLKRAFPRQFDGWEPKIKEMIPGYGVKLNENEQLAAEIEADTNKVLGLS
ncbi:MULTISPECIES: malate:quinone oxidoreductase [unclassified Arthrobacter]|uniref:malate:quinone oxidoreductase n=1 Tax=unclassified Arthrobacter TaxID=235627 RepID=UPI001D15AE24|nr:MULTISPECIES: malate:quinone oxidoreductase [unclassified Arthrobacter]MCC3290622.1 malate:quinone oxidoreductase [Arthrobacter sp. zg-Y1110]MCC3299866.1 malate:quinone oxidoreductase [Arthrobacter sp. zg-Y895]MCQ1945245.1 malate:quinone oxidoreductase [Arthrobacter sp. zg-Y1116]MCQ1985191.1 malate:quinone oxidoreductase [Arthrobacter sp. zg-Y844]MCQ1995094.1 malate:quinone oxidoreductase [Arthrobacter sp. zg-Y1171]